MAAATPPGVQPESDEWMLCLECGIWCRSVARHVQKHEMNAATYREAHGLRLRHPLVAADIRAGHSERAQQRMEADPQSWDDHFRHTPDKLGEIAAKGRDSLNTNRDRPGQAAAVRAAWSKALDVRSARMRGDLDARAQKLGYADLDAYLTAQKDAFATDLARDLGVTTRTVQNWRQRLFGAVPDRGRPTDSAKLSRLRALDARARELGYANLADMIQATAEMPVKRLVRETGLSRNTIRLHRRRSADG